MVMAPVPVARARELRALLDTMNSAPGMADPGNALLPFGQFERLHFARLVLLDDLTLADVEAYGLRPSNAPVYLALMGDCDGSANEMLADLARRAGPGLRRNFAQCEGFDADGDLLAWMLAHNARAAASYVNWVGTQRARRQGKSALQRALTASPAPHWHQTDAQRLSDLIAFV